jgi:hypothetical protein
MERALFDLLEGVRREAPGSNDWEAFRAVELILGQAADEPWTGLKPPF